MLDGLLSWPQRSSSSSSSSWALIEDLLPFACSLAGQWVFYFIVSKVFEFGDTVFLVLLQKEINFLHW